MKKYITIAALLAAGTAFANAATTEELVDFSTLMNSGTVVGTVTDTSSEYVDGNVVYSFDGAKVGLTTESVVDALTADSGIIVIAAWINLNSDASQYNTIFGWGASGTGFKFCVKDDDLCLVTKNVAETVKGFSISKGAWEMVALQYNVANKNFRLQATTTNGQFYTVTDNTSMNAVTTKQFAIGSANGNATSEGENFDGLIGNLKVFTTNAYLNNTEVLSVLGAAPTLAPVPEPSAFGLLAGIGALALVASRRRRK